MNLGKAWAILIIMVQVGCSFSYLLEGDFRRALYWLFGAAISATITL